MVSRQSYTWRPIETFDYQLELSNNILLEHDRLDQVFDFSIYIPLSNQRSQIQCWARHLSSPSNGTSSDIIIKVLKGTIPDNLVAYWFLNRQPR